MLTIRNPRAEDEGAYTCEALNNKGSIFAQPDCILTIIREYSASATFYSAIHKAAVQRSAGGWNDPQTPFPTDSFTTFSGIVPGKAGNGSAGGFVNSTVIVTNTEMCRSSIVKLVMPS